MRVGLFFLVTTFGALGASSAYAAPQCSDGVDNDGDGQIDFMGGNFGEAPPDTDCRNPEWNSEASGSDLGYHPYDGGSASDGGTLGVDGGTSCGDIGCPQTTDGGNPYAHPDGGMGMTSVGGNDPNGGVDPPRHGCDLGGSSSATLPLLLVLGTGAGLALLSRRTRA
jgi:hypothetical protein